MSMRFMLQNQFQYQYVIVCSDRMQGHVVVQFDIERERRELHLYSKNRNKRGNFHNKRDKIGACFDVPKKLDCSRKILQKKPSFWYQKLPRLFRTFPRLFRFFEYTGVERKWDRL